MRRKGFTLIELLVVIAIIAILAAILFPVFAQAREKARSLSCLSNVRQMATGMMMYVQDYDEMFPQSWTAGVPQRWMHKIEPYTKNRNIRDCPSTPWKAGSTGGGSYGYNRQVFENISLSAITEPAGTIMFGDAAEIAPPNGADDRRSDTWRQLRTVDHDFHFSTPNPRRPICFRWSTACAGGNYRRPFPRHQGGANLAFADGHAKWMKVDQVIAPNWGDPNCLYDNDF